MASTIQLKRGSGAPTSGDLAAGELGLDLTNNVIYSSSDGSDIIQMSSLGLSDLGITATVTELNYVDGVTSNIQTQLDALPTALTDFGITATSTELNYVDGVTSNIQTQLDAKIESVSFTGITGNIEATGSLLKIFEGSSYATSDYHVFENSNESTGIAVFDHNGTVPVGLRVRYLNAAPINGTSAQAYLLCSDTSATRFYIIPNGSVYNVTGTYGTISDVNLKQQIVDASSQWDDIKAVQVRNYKYNTDVNESGDSDELWRIGVIAQELEAVSPSLVEETYEQDGGMYKAVKTSVLHMKALKALQEAMDRIETLESKVAVLEGGA